MLIREYLKMNKFIANGREELRNDPQTQEMITNIEKQVKEVYLKRISEAGWFRRILLRYRMGQEIRDRIDQIVPKNGLYLINGKRDSQVGSLFPE